MISAITSAPRRVRAERSDDQSRATAGAVGVSIGAEFSQADARHDRPVPPTDDLDALTQASPRS